MGRFALLVLLSGWSVGWGQSATTTSTLRTGKETEPFYFEHYDQNKGISQGTGYAIAAYDGFMWFATQDGLNRFDGYGFRVFRSGGPTDLHNSYTQALLADSKGKLWVGTSAGLNRFNQQTETFETLRQIIGRSHPLDSVAIEHLLEDRRGYLWVMTEERGLFRIDPARRTVRSYLRSNTTLSSFCLAPNGDLWLCDYNELYRYDADRDQFQPIRIRNWLAPKSILGPVVFDTSGKLWMGTRQDGVYVLTDPVHHGRVRQYRAGPAPDHLSSNEITRLMRDRRGRIWVGTRTGGVSLFDPAGHGFAHLRNTRHDARSLADDNVWSFCEDARGLIWLGFSSHGVDKYDPNRFPFQLIQRDPDDPVHSLSSNMIFTLLGAGNDLFIGTETGGLFRYSLTTHRTTPLATLMPEQADRLGSEVRVIVADSDKNFWLANWRGLCRYDPRRQTFRWFDFDTRKSIYQYGALAVNDAGGRTTEIWTMGQGGMSRFDTRSGRWKTWDDIPAIGAIADYTVRLVYADSRKNCWLGTLEHGLLRYDPVTKTVRTFDARNGLTCNAIRSLLEDGSTLWVGTDCGLYALDLPTLTVRQHLDDKPGRVPGVSPAAFQLPNNVIYGILKDDAGYLWLSSNKGLTRFSPRRGVSKNYDLTDGLQSNEFNTNVCYKHTDGTLFFGGVNGITYFRTDQFRKNSFVPPVRITQTTVLDSIYPPNQSHLTLAHDQNFITFAFTALNYSNTEKNQYQYQLSGIDERWVPTQHQRTAKYTKLPPGDYVFRVKGSNDDGIWNERGTSMRITIKPPFWGTLWFRLLLIALLIGGTVGVYRYRIYELKNRQAHELAVSIRTQELERQRFSKELHDGVGANLSVLKMYLASIGDPSVPADALKARSIALLKTSVASIRQLIHDMHPRSLSELGLTQTLTEMVALVNESGQLTVVLEAENVPLHLSEVAEINLFRVMQELVQNAIKHANARTVWLTLRHDAGLLTVTYKDDGRGFDTSRVNGKPHHGSGNGLANIRQRIALLNGNFTLQSAENQGTAVEISIPVVA